MSHATLANVSKAGERASEVWLVTYNFLRVCCCADECRPRMHTGFWRAYNCGDIIMQCCLFPGLARRPAEPTSFRPLHFLVTTTLAAAIASRGACLSRCGSVKAKHVRSNFGIGKAKNSNMSLFALVALHILWAWSHQAHHNRV